MNRPSWTVHKFGGTSVGSAERYRHVAQVLLDRGEDPCAVVVSAMKGVTDTLIGLVEAAAKQDASYLNQLDALADRLSSTLHELLSGARAAELDATFSRDIEDIADLLRATWLLREASKGSVDLISGYGEIWSAQTLCAHLNARGHETVWLDAREVLTVEPSEQGSPSPLLEQSEEELHAWLQANRGEATTVIITGFIARTANGRPTTLGRNGSDYSAAIFSALLSAPSLYIWTDVDGVMSANPRLVPDAQVLDQLSYQEAMELAYFGAKVLHPSTIAPAVARDVEITIKNTFNVDAPGTLISSTGGDDFAIKGFTTIDDIALLNLEGTNMLGVPGIASRLFSALRDAGVSVIVISQASSEHSICFAVPSSDVDAAQQVVEQAFFAERHRGQLNNLSVSAPCSILAAVGDQMAGQVGIAGQFLQALGNAHINVRAIAQGSSERNISVVIDQDDAKRALRAVHSSFYLSHKTISVGLVGAGVVGSVLLSQLDEQRALLLRDYNVDIQVRAIATTRGMLLSEETIDATTWAEREAALTPTDLAALVEHVKPAHVPHAVLIDCTASDDVASLYGSWMEQGVHVITPNKKANTKSMQSYRALRQARRKNMHYLYETTVGAGLPIIQTLRDLIQTGDRIERIEGILSGTLSYLFNVYDGTRPFSEIVAEAKELGYTEPDPRDDLSGTDVARKVVILGREMGLELELDQISLEGLVPEELEGASVEEFMEKLPEHDDAMRARYESARERGCVLRFVGSVSRDGSATVTLEELPLTHAFARINFTDNIVQFTTARYNPNPLVVQGPGAGPGVTAAGIFSDLLRLASYVGVSR